jgi:starvation-inducible DNA-binding protein
MNKIGLHPEKSALLCHDLNSLLANYMVFYQNTRGFHWNIRGEKFFELHLKFEELYNDLILKIDEIAERILTLGGIPLHTFEDYIQISQIKSAKNVQQGSECIAHILNSFEILIVQQRKILTAAADIDDEGTNALMSDYIREQEKLVWMYGAYLNKP